MVIKVIGDICCRTCGLLWFERSGGVGRCPWGVCIPLMAWQHISSKGPYPYLTPICCVAHGQQICNRSIANGAALARPYT